MCFLLWKFAKIITALKMCWFFFTLSCMLGGKKLLGIIAGKEMWPLLFLKVIFNKTFSVFQGIGGVGGWLGVSFLIFLN